MPLIRQKIIYVDNFLTVYGQTPTTGTTLAKLFTEEGYKVITTSRKQNKAFRLLDMLYTIISKGRNSVVLVATYSTSAFFFAWACSQTCRVFQIPYIPCLHGGDLPERIKKSPKKSAQLFGNSFTNVAVSAYLQKSMADNGWQSVLIPNNIKIECYPFKERKECAPTLLWVRSFHKIYNPLLAIQVLHKLLVSNPSSTLVMVGPDKDGSLEECKALAKRLNIEKSITFTGLLPRDEWVTIAEKCSVFINTTNFDNLPVSVVEAMALGLIIISTNVGGLPYLIEDRDNGILVPPDNPMAFVNAIDGVLNDRLFAHKLSVNARCKAEEFDWRNIRTSWRSLLNSVPS